MSNKILAFVLAYKEPPVLTLYSLLTQNLGNDMRLDVVIIAAYNSACKIPEKVIEAFNRSDNKKILKCLVIKVPQDNTLEIGERVGFSLTIAMRIYDIKYYDYILKLDDDVYLPRDFIRKHVKINKDVVGTGCAVLFKTSSYIKLFNHSWPINTLDDFIAVYSVELFNRTRSLAWIYVTQPLFLRTDVKIDMKRWIKMGMDYFLLGFHPLFMLFYIIRRLIKIPRYFSLNSRLKYVLWHYVMLISYILVVLKIINIKKYRKNLWFSKLVTWAQINLIKRKFFKIMRSNNRGYK